MMRPTLLLSPAVSPFRRPPGIFGSAVGLLGRGAPSIRHLLFAWVLGVSVLPATAHSTGPSGWVVTLDWSPETCFRKPGSREAQCAESHGLIVRRMEPVFAPGGSTHCADSDVDQRALEQAAWEVPNRAYLRRMWQQDGACSGLSAHEYFIQVARANRRWTSIDPATGMYSNDGVRPESVLEAFQRLNPEVGSESVTMQCTRAHFSALRICTDAQLVAQVCPVVPAPTCPPDYVRVRTTTPSARTRQARR